MLDPTCGSGAFLFAALEILKPLYEACLDRMGGFVADCRPAGPRTKDHPAISATRWQRSRQASQPRLLHLQVHHRQ